MRNDQIDQLQMLYEFAQGGIGIHRKDFGDWTVDIVSGKDQEGYQRIKIYESQVVENTGSGQQ